MCIRDSSTRVMRMENGNSRFRMPDCTFMGFSTAQIPTTTSKLNRLEPITLLMAISLAPLRDAEMLTAASGALVPKATMVRPIIIVGRCV